MMRILLVVGLVACQRPPALSLPQKHEESPAAVDPARLKPAMLSWGRVHDSVPFETLEMIYPASYNGREVWRSVQRSDDPTDVKGFFQMDDVDKATLRPVRSIYKGAQDTVTQTFDGDKVRVERVREGKTSSWEFTFEETVMPSEGVGGQLLIGSLPLREGYTATFYRFTPASGFTGSEPDPAKHGVRPWRVSVAGRETIRTPAGEFDTWVVVVEPADGSAGAVSKYWARVAPPHYQLRLDYTPEPGGPSYPHAVRWIALASLDLNTLARAGHHRHTPHTEGGYSCADLRPYEAHPG